MPIKENECENYNIYAEIEKEAFKNKSHIALIYNDIEITFEELIDKVNEYALILKHYGVSKGENVGVMLEKSVELIYSILAIFKIGAVYVPINPEYPDVRRKYIIDDAAINNVITSTLNIGDINHDLPDKNFIIVAKLPEINIDKNYNIEISKKDDTAYIFYTSGSTGNPKGAILNHGGLKNRILWQKDYFQIVNDNKILFKAPIGFDISLWEFLVPLVSGATMVISKDGGYKDIDYVISLIKKNKIDILQFVPSLLRIFLDKVRDEDSLLRDNAIKVVSSGEEITLQLIQSFYEILPNSNLYNFYGPTETTICVTAKELKKNDEFVSIGQKLNDSIDVLLRNENHQEIIGDNKKGEICISGICVGKGYLNLEKETYNSFKNEGDKVVYYTGDIGMYNKGELVYIGRKDRTLKINGNRVDLGEIEIAVNRLPYVEICHVTSNKREDGVSLIYLFVKKLNINQKGIPEKIRKDLKDILPLYMIPHFIIEKDEFILTENGKVDVKQLKYDDVSNSNEMKDCLDSNDFVEKLFKVKFGRIVKSNEDFFELGGSSIEAIEIINKINHKYNSNISFLDIITSFSIDNVYKSLQ